MRRLRARSPASGCGTSSGIDQLQPLVRGVLSEDSDGAELELTAVNRRGRTVRLRVSVSRLISTSADLGGALLLMDQRGDEA